MKLKDLIDALASEIESVRPELEKNLDDLSRLTLDDPSFMETMEQYTGQVQRMGEAVELAGFPGLSAVCGQVLDNTLLIAALPMEERPQVIEFLRTWPPLMVHYLHHIEDPSTAAGLVDHLRAAPNPLDEQHALRIMHMLGAMPLMVGMESHEQGGHQRPIVATADDVALVVPGDVDQKLMDGFFQEAPGQAQHLVELVNKMSQGQSASADLVVAKRVAHTLKGSGAIIGLRGLASLGHHFEDILEHFEQQDGHVAKPVADVLLNGAYCLEQMVAYVTGTDEYPEQAQAVLQDVLDLANRIDNGEDVDQPVHRGDHQSHDTSRGDLARVNREVSTATPIPSATAQRAPMAAPAAALRVNLDRIEELFRVSAEVSVHTAAMEARVKQLTALAKELTEQNLRVQKRLFELETVVDVRALTMMRARSERDDKAAFDPLEMDQYSELHSTAHALVEDAADARVMSHRLQEELSSLAAMQNRQQLLSRDLQHLVIGTKMAEVGSLESRLQRNIRTTSQATGKQVVLTLKGGGTLIDSDVLSRMSEPLLHILRNAVDHGLETPEERRKAGKSDVGSVVLDFSRQGQQVVLRCQDDGRGLDLLAIQRRAIERGLVAQDQPLSEDELARLILMPGFSTRDQVSEVSGRGVGLDVVRDWVTGMNGTIRISSVPRKGCTIELRFAASLTTVQSLIVDAGGQRYGLPSIQVEQAVPHGIGRFEWVGQQLTYHLDRRAMRALYLTQLTGQTGHSTELPQETQSVVVVRLNERFYALIVDQLLDARELLVKDPGRYARHLRGVAGLSILGDGSIAVNLDLVQLLDQTGAGAGRTASSVRTALKSNAVVKEQTPLVLVVDDAISVRDSLKQLLEDAGYRAETARDGIEAVNAMRANKPHVVLTDLEMPNMNGIELTSHIRQNDELSALPVIMITSRSQEKHRKLAQEAGVNLYLTKPYSDQDLLQGLKQCLKDSVALA